MTGGRELASVPVIRALAEKHGFRFSRELGQNFLADPRIPRAIAEGARVDGRDAVEIGPGIGTLTVELARRARRVAALELDRALLPILEETLAPWPNVSVRRGDVLKTDLAALADEAFGPEARVCAVSNLPYNVTGKAVLARVRCRRFESVTVMLQREAAAKLTAAPGDGDWCLWSALVTAEASAEKLMSVPKGCFYPVPKVDSTVLRLTPRADAPADPAAFERTARAVFAARRKTVRNALAAPGRTESGGAEALLLAAGVDPGRRGETLSTEEIEELSRLLVQKTQKE